MGSMSMDSSNAIYVEVYIGVKVRGLRGKSGMCIRCMRIYDDDDVYLNSLQHGSGLRNLFSVSFNVKTNRPVPIRA
jgi:hypothetical protein